MTSNISLWKVLIALHAIPMVVLLLTHPVSTIAFVIQHHQTSTNTNFNSFYQSATLLSSTVQQLDDDLVLKRLPTSVDDQIRQATISLQRATTDKQIYRHTIRLLLPIIGATELDDWPGGTRQQMEAAYPLVQSILSNSILYTTSSNNATAATTINTNKNDVKIQTVIIDESDGVAALYVEAPTTSRDDSCTVLLPTAETVSETIQPSIEQQVGTNRNLILVNPQWKRRSDFGTFGSAMNPFANLFGGNNKIKAENPIEYVEKFVPTYSLTNFIVEGELIRILRTHPGPWRVFQQIPTGRSAGDDNDVDWIMIGEKPFVPTKPSDWEEQPYNKQDGGLLFQYGQPTYNDITTMIRTNPNYTAKNPAERAAAAFQFIKDSL